MAAHASCRALAHRTGTSEQDWFPVFKARYGMRLAFDALRRIVGDGEVATQLFTCCTAVDPITAAGLTPRYADIDAGTLSVTAASLRPLLSDATRAVVVQHTFGMVDDGSSAAVAAAAHAAGALVVEDCAHCVGRVARDGDGMSVADVSVHSFGVEKMLPTRFGGAIWVNPRLRDRMPQVDQTLRAALAGLPEPGVRLGMVTRTYVNQNRVFSRLGALGARIRHACAAAGLYEPAIAPEEMAGGLRYPAYAMNAWMDRKAAAAIGALDANEESRRRIVALYRRRLGAARGIEVPGGAMAGPAQPLLRFPLLAADTAAADRLIHAARAAGGYAEAWYRPELFPGVTDPAAYGLDRLDRATVVVSDEMVSRSLCLPTELGEDRAHAVCDAVCEAAC
ncbi:DegT/DnrJ/EryC1/StrS family aminotransferase [Bifidobacterium pullorum subsp. saeculare]|uniref:DegT/DnrJ/EryC1/StrS family aminotransferase n=1 Tax=Bifidobacterium pullorum subsp. saeculare TaxID=78257 RepID=A0A938WW29_9BIFI|nr:DegT/DnrJ/EryC1/StrS family aminotransferase [Bifidobacterium pullorum]MBM6698971.1 DegT/DnrJ/EryC1/StrS family aminotransferase [Bifidobacterium pullorum subsp. saeculare]